MSRRQRRDMVFVAVVLAVSAGVLGWAQSARAGVNPPSELQNYCNIAGHLEAEPGHVTAVFTVAETCREVSLLSWLAPDAHAGNPQTLYDRRSRSDVPPGDYRWTITRPAPGCFFQLDLRVPGHNVDALLGGMRKCETTPSTTTTSPTPTTTSSLPPDTPTTSVSTNPTTTTTSITATSSNAPTTIAVGGTPSTPIEELPHSGNGEVGAMTVAGLALIGLGRLSLKRGRNRDRAYD